MADPVVCQACGSKIKVGRSQCPRCGEPLAGSPDETEAGGPRDPKTGRALIAGTVVSLIVLALAAASILKPAPAPTSPVVTPSAVPPPVSIAIQPSAEVAVDSQPGEPRFLDADRAGTSAYAKGDLEAAVARYQEAVDRNPKDIESLNNLGQVLVRVGRAAEAIPYFERAVALDASRWAPRFNLARAYGQTGDWKRSVAEYQMAAEKFPQDYVTHYNLGLALHKLGQEDSAITEYQKAIQLAPGEPSFRLSLGISYEKLNKTAEAVRAYEQYLELAPAAAAEAAQTKARIDALKRATEAPPGAPSPAAQPRQADSRS